MKQCCERWSVFTKNLWIKLKKISIFEYSLAFLLIVSFVFFYFVDFQFSDKQILDSLTKPTDDKLIQSIETPPSLSTSTPKPTPKPIPTGKQIYYLGHGKNVKGPKISQVVIDPLDPSVGKTQIVTVKITHTSPITSVKATLETDNMNKTYTFKRIAGSDTDGTWQTSWIIEDSYDYVYYLFFRLTSEIDTFEGGLTFR